MKNTDSVPRGQSNEKAKKITTETTETDKNKKDKSHKKKNKRNTWPIKAMIITLLLAALVNLFSTLVLEGAKMWLAIVITLFIVLLGVLFDIIGTASTSCDIQPLLAMASRKVKGAKTAVKLAQKSDIVSNVCNDIVGDICGIVSGACAASITLMAFDTIADTTVKLLLTVLVYAAISTLTITLKAIGKTIAVNNSTNIIFGVAKILSIFRKDG